MLTPAATAPDLRALLQDVRTIAVVGCSDSLWATSHRIAGYLVHAGFEVIPVNPNHATVLGRTCYASVEDVPYGTEIDLVCIFRQPRFAAEMVETVLRRIAVTGERPVVWTQIGVHSPEAEHLAVAAGLPYVRNRCIMVEHAR
jgi:uncharacterized protein